MSEKSSSTSCHTTMQLENGTSRLTPVLASSLSLLISFQKKFRPKGGMLVFGWYPHNQEIKKAITTWQEVSFWRWWRKRPAWYNGAIFNVPLYFKTFHVLGFLVFLKIPFIFAQKISIGRSSGQVGGFSYFLTKWMFWIMWGRQIWPE